MILPPHNRGDLSAAQWKRIAPNLPPQKPAVGRPNNDHQTIINKSCGFSEPVLRGGISPIAMDPGKPSQDAFTEPRKQGIWQRLLQALQQQAEAKGQIDWEINFVDGSVIRAHQHAAGAVRGEIDPNSELSAIEQVQEREALGWSKGGFSTKIHLRCDGNGRPITFLVSVGERHEAVLFEPLMEQGSVKRAGPGRPRIRPHRVSGDKGYSSAKIRRYLRRRGIRYTIARKANEHRGGKFDKALYRMRNRVERCFNRLKQYRRIATRYEKMAENYLTMLTIASIIMWL